MKQQMIINGRFLKRPITGVERYGREMLRIWDRLALAGEAPIVKIYVPCGTPDDLNFSVLKIEVIGTHQGHFWEQFDLARATRGHTLISLANSGPIFHQHHLVVLHDAAPFRFPNAYALHYRLWHRFLGRALSRTARLATVSMFSQGELAYVLKLAETAIAVVPSGGDHLGQIMPDSRIIARLALVPCRYFLAVGSANPNKNTSLLFDTWQRCAAKIPSGVKLVVVGDVTGRAFRAFLPVPGENVNLVLPGRVSDAELAALYQSAAAFIFPSFYEGFGIPPLEAMSYGIPVLAADIAPLRETCGNAALYFSPHEESELSRLMERVFAPQFDRQAQIENGRAQLQKFKWQASVERLLAAASF